MKLTIIVPAFNEERTISKILDKLLQLKTWPWTKEIIVVDDHSTDDTSKTLKKFSKKTSIKILTHSKNLGKTAAIKTALGKSLGDYIIIQDADLEYNPGDINRLLKEALKNPQKIIYGSRFLGSHVDTVFGHKTGNLLLTTLTNLLYGCHLSDMETCYKLVPRDYFTKFTIESDRFGFEPEVTAKIIRSGGKIIEVPISYSKRGVTEGKSIRWWKDGWATVRILLQYRFNHYVEN